MSADWSGFPKVCHSLLPSRIYTLKINDSGNGKSLIKLLITSTSVGGYNHMNEGSIIGGGTID